MSRDVAIPAILATLCLCPSAIDPPPISVLLKTKVKPKFDRTVDRTVEALFPVFQGFNQAQFQPCFLVFTVRSAEGRNRLELPFWLTAECLWLSARLSKIFQLLPLGAGLL